MMYTLIVHVLISYINRLLVAQREAALLKGEKSDMEEAISTAQAKL